MRLATLLLLALAPAAASATTIVSIVPGRTALDPGEQTSIAILAHFDAPIVGFGIDLVFDASVLAWVGAPTIGSDWTPVAAPDADGLAGLAPPAGLLGDVVLATGVLEALAPGRSELRADATPGDLTEGFALLGLGFDDVVFEPVEIVVGAEPVGLAGLALAALILAARRRCAC